MLIGLTRAAFLHGGAAFGPGAFNGKRLNVFGKVIEKNVKIAKKIIKQAFIHTSTHMFCTCTCVYFPRSAVGNLDLFSSH